MRGGKHQSNPSKPVAESWWESIQPSSAEDMIFAKAQCEPPISRSVAEFAIRAVDGTTELGRKWSEYDSKKLILGHDIIQLTSSILRSRATATQADLGIARASAFELPTLVFVFCTCAELNLKKSSFEPHFGDEEADSPPLIEESLIYVAENLICSIYAVAKELSTDELGSFASVLGDCTRSCDKYPARSFINTIGRWVEKLIVDEKSR